MEKEFNSLPQDFIVTVLPSIENYSDVTTAILDYLINERKMSGIYFTINKPYETLVNTLKNNNIDAKKLFFIDAISGIVGKKSSAANCVIVQNPCALTELSIQITDIPKGTYKHRSCF